MAGATLCAVRLSGKLKGEIMLIGPMGKRRVIAVNPFVRADVSMGAHSPVFRHCGSIQANSDPTMCKPLLYAIHLFNNITFFFLVSAAWSTTNH